MIFKKLVHESSIELPHNIEWDRHFNHMPTPWVEISEDEYWHRTSGENIAYTWYQQVRDIGPKMVPIRFILTRENIYGESEPLEWRCSTQEEIDSGAYRMQYTEKKRYFRVGCIHDFSRRKIGNCLNEYKCTKCGHVKIVDSSD